MSEKRKLPIDRPCSACSAGDTKMEYHDHCPPFREPVASPQEDLFNRYIECCKEWREITKCPEGKNFTDHLKELMSKLPVT